MAKYTRIPQNTFDELQMDAGILLDKFDVTGVTEVQDADIICPTTGGIHIICEPTYSDMGEDVDNCPVNMKELKHLDGWDIRIEFTSLGTSSKSIKLALGAADIDAETSKISLRKDLSQDDFADIWWVGDKTNGGFVAAHLMNALSTGGFDLQTTKSGKGQSSMVLTGHVSIDAQDQMPIEFYSLDGDATGTPEILLNAHVKHVDAGETAELTARVTPATAEVTWTSADNEVATVADGVVTAVAEGNIVVTASITVDGVTYTDTCTIVVAGA